jgi:hypothetical protein
MNSLVSVNETFSINSTNLQAASFANLSLVGGPMTLSAGWPAESWSFPSLASVEFSQLTIESPSDVLSANAGQWGALEFVYELQITGNFPNL